jgi:lipid-binding SYLF domain-containing protein
VGASFDGSVINPSEDLNKAFYGKEATPVEILVHGNVKNKAADGLRSDLNKVTAK